MTWTKLDWNFINEIAIGVALGLFLHEFATAIVAGLATQVDWFKVLREVLRGTETALVLCAGVGAIVAVAVLLGPHLPQNVVIVLALLIGVSIPIAWWIWRGKALHKTQKGAK